MLLEALSPRHNEVVSWKQLSKQLASSTTFLEAIYDLAVENPSTGAVAAVSTTDNTN
jgi:hypothetical protein